MRLSILSGIMEIEKGVTALTDNTLRDLHMIRKQNPIIVLLVIQNNS